MEIINHSLHEHALSLSEKKREDKIRCDACNEDCDEGVMIYSCRKCDFDLHESCAKLLQELLHNPLLHPHPLSLVNPHNLILMHDEEDDDDDEVLCKACYENCDEGVMIFSCRESDCDFNLHESCAKLPQELHNPLLHPHPLSLHRQDNGYEKCNACCKTIPGFTFRCEKDCNVNFDVKCAFIRPAAIEEGGEEAEAVVVGTHHFTHPEHPLVALENMPADRFHCSICQKYCSDQKTYGCLPCGFFLHPSCFNLPEEIFRPFHPHHPLTLKRIKDDDDVKCNACHNDIYRDKYVGCFAYFCEECDFDLDLECTFIRPAAIEEWEELVPTQHFSDHEHPLLLLEKIPTSRIRCCVCGGWCSDPKTYGCLPCGIFLHPSCSMFHPFHPYHPLTLKQCRSSMDYDVKCNACRHHIFWDDYYFCERCNNTKTSCHLHRECASVIMPAITYEGHDHLLLFNHNMKNRGDHGLITYCIACESTCKSTCESYGFRCLDLHFDYHTIGTDVCSACKSTICEASYGFRCLDLDCDFNLHLTCGPLPYSIQHKSHIHPLTLTNCPIEDEKDCELDEFYCNACEEERDPFMPIYYCNECHFVAGISCVISEVVSLLKGEHDGDVELRNPFGQFGNLIREKQQLVIKPALTLSDIFNSLSEAEKNEMDDAFQRFQWFLPIAMGSETITLGNWEYAEDFLMDSMYEQFLDFVNIGIEIPNEFLVSMENVQISNFEVCYRLHIEEEVVNIGDYKITRKLAPILKDLLSKYGDVSAESKLSPKVKLYFFHVLCECIYSMKNIKVVDITNINLLNWWASLESSKFAGFRIQFAFDHLKRVALAHFGLYIEKHGSEALARLDSDIEALKRERKELKRRRESLSSIKSNLIEKCSRETSMRKGWKAGVGLL